MRQAASAWRIAERACRAEVRSAGSSARRWRRPVGWSAPAVRWRPVSHGATPLAARLVAARARTGVAVAAAAQAERPGVR